MTDSIFSPSFGNKPSNLIGRDHVMGMLTGGLKAMPGSKERARLIIGQRGMGKTVLLLELAEFARANGFIVASPTVVSSDMLDRILEKLERDGEKLLQKEKVRITGASVGILGFSAGIQTENNDQPKRSFAYKLQDLCEKANEEGKAVLILVDEVQSNSEELKKLIIAYQELVGEGCDIAIVMAGLPSSISRTLNQHVLTFLNRASKMNLEPISVREIAVYYRDCFRKLGIDMDERRISMAANRTEGSPYMMQLIGHYITISASENGKLSDEDFIHALAAAQDEFIDDICGTTLSTLSEMDVEFLKAMSADSDESAIKDICARLEVDSAYANRYKSRLIQFGVIQQKRRGYVEFAVPYLKDFLKHGD